MHSSSIAYQRENLVRHMQTASNSCSPATSWECSVIRHRKRAARLYFRITWGNTFKLSKRREQELQLSPPQRARTQRFVNRESVWKLCSTAAAGMAIVRSSNKGGGGRQYPSPAPCVITIAFPISSEQEIMISSRKWQELRHRHRHDARKQISPNGNRMENHTRSQPRARKPCSPITKCKTRILASARG